MQHRHRHRMLDFIDDVASRATHSIHNRTLSLRQHAENSPTRGIIIMGKSNKFDYTNRNSSGAKLGDSVGKALIKEAKKIESDAQKHSSGRRSTSGTGHSSESKDVSSHKIDLKAPSKQLGNEGIFALADGLEAALSSRSGDVCLQLEDLNLADNGLTTHSLARLAPIILLARYDLKTLNLSDNAIVIETDEEAHDWEVFLQAFRPCRRLRRLDFCGNALDAKAFEILLRVYSQEPKIDPLPPGGLQSVISLADEEIQNPDDEGRRRISSQRQRASSDVPAEEYDQETDFTLAKGRVLAMRCGLRSTPYLTLQNVSMTDAAALWLSYIVCDHYYPVQLIDDLNAALASSAIRAYQQDADTQGLDWDRNDGSLGKDGAQLLKRTELLRRQRFCEELDAMTSSMTSEISDSYDLSDQAITEQITPTKRRTSRAVSGGRRFSMRSGMSLDDEIEMTEIDSARRKIQRHIIATSGAGSVELWRAALAVVISSRLLLVLAPTSHNSYTGETMFEVATEQKVSSESRSDSVTKEPDETQTSLLPESFSQPLEIEITTRQTRSRARSNAVSWVTQPSSDLDEEPPLTVYDNTNMLAATKMPPKEDFPAFVDRLDALVIRGKSRDYLAYQHQRIEQQRQKATNYHQECPANPYRSETTPCHLPQALVEKILALAMFDKKAINLNILSPQQRRVAVRWGQDRATIKRELEWRRKDESAQIWMLLDGVGCLTYESWE